MKSVLIQNVRIYDGSGAAAIPGDIRIVGDRFAQIGPNLANGESFVLDANGLVAAPGFIDMHSHADLALLHQPVPDQKIRQGVTTELLGQDGLGVAPVDAQTRQDLQEIIGGLQGQLPAESWTWNSFAEYLERLDQTSLPNNVAVLATHAPLRLAAVGMEKRPASNEDIEKMRKMLDECLQAGAFGFSTGLEYPPQYHAETAELIALNRIVASHGGVYVVHQRNEGMQLEQSFEEQLTIGRLSGVHLHISHLKAWGRANWQRIDPVLQAAETYHQLGNKITWDRYPYLSGSTLLGIILPHWAWSQGTEALIQQLGNQSFRERLRSAYRLRSDEWEHDPGSIGWHNILISGVNLPDNKWMVGKNIVEIAAEVGTDEVSLVSDLLAAERLAVTAIFHYGNMGVLRKVLTHPLACVGSDGILLGQPHPRLYGSFPRFLDEFALKNRILSLNEAIHKVTAFPASILGLKDRGMVREGWYADLVLLHPQQLRAPGDDLTKNAYPKGVEHVFLNGSWVVQYGDFCGDLHGLVLRKES